MPYKWNGDITISKREYRYIVRSNKNEFKSGIQKNSKMKKKDNDLKMYIDYSYNMYDSYNNLYNSLNNHLKKYMNYSKYLEELLDNKVIDDVIKGEEQSNQSSEQSNQSSEQDNEIKSPETFY